VDSAVLSFALIDTLTDHWPEFRTGFWVTVRLIVASFVVAMVVGTLVAALRIAPNKWLQRLGGIYVEVFRNIPLLVLLFISYAGLRRGGVDINAWVAGIGSLGLYTAAYVAEALRSGVFSVGKGQIEASLTLGFSYAETLRRIILPQAFRTVISPLGSLTIAMIKNSAIIGVSLLALPDLLKQARIVQARTFETNETFFWAAVGYLILTGAVTLVIRNLENRFAIRR
jgi:His/Glu/Gln/Arg/opine family amino acid ABC transporter permease subunit